MWITSYIMKSNPSSPPLPPPFFFMQTANVCSALACVCEREKLFPLHLFSLRVSLSRAYLEDYQYCHQAPDPLSDSVVRLGRNSCTIHHFIAPLHWVSVAIERILQLSLIRDGGRQVRLCTFCHLAVDFFSVSFGCLIYASYLGEGLVWFLPFLNTVWSVPLTFECSFVFVFVSVMRVDRVRWSKTELRFHFLLINRKKITGGGMKQ